VEYAHKQGIIHRDIKPSNILITDSGQPTLSDFGIAKILTIEETTALTGTGIGVGTPEYMAPEQAIGSATPQSDIYSLGVVLYEMVTGRKPFTADTPLAVMIKHINDPLPPPTRFVPQLPMSVVRILIKSLAKKTDNRYPDTGAMAAAMENCLSRPTQDPESTVEELEEGPTQNNFESISGGRKKPEPQKGPRTTTVILKWALGLAMVACLGIALSTSGYFFLRNFTPPGPSQISRMSSPAPSDSPPNAIEPFAPTAPVLNSPIPTIRPTMGSVMTSEIDGMVLVYVPDGVFVMGAAKGAQFANPDEMPVHDVEIAAFWIDKTEITNAMFMVFVEKTGYQTDAEKAGTGIILDFSQVGSPWMADAPGVNWRHPHNPSDDISVMAQRPVVQISWNDAYSYCRWAGRWLPTEAEWEKAARGTDGRLYPWGDNPPGMDLLNFDRKVGHLTEVGSYPDGASPYGALDMLGNAYEWVNDWYDPTYYSYAPDTDPQGPSQGTTRVIRGGSWNYGLNWTRTTSRSSLNPAARTDTLGFRCATG
jgi:formylglycine-generating enzyme required for sulfatase activity